MGVHCPGRHWNRCPPSPENGRVPEDPALPFTCASLLFCVCVWGHMSWCQCGQRSTALQNLFSLSTSMWILGINLRLPGFLSKQLSTLSYPSGTFTCSSELVPGKVSPQAHPSFWHHLQSLCCEPPTLIICQKDSLNPLITVSTLSFVTAKGQTQLSTSRIQVSSSIELPNVRPSGILAWPSRAVWSTARVTGWLSSGIRSHSWP